MKEAFTREAVMALWPVNRFTAGLILRLGGLHLLNEVYDHAWPSSGLELVRRSLEDVNITFQVSPHELELLPQDGPFIVVANHPFGIADGLGLLQVISQRRPTIKMTANFLLSSVKDLQELFIYVNPWDEGGKKGMGGTRLALEHLHSGHPLALLPAGEVSTYYGGAKEVRDRIWGLSSMRLIQEARVPVIPWRFHGENSRLFHVMGKLHPGLRTLRLAREFVALRDQVIPVSLGAPIPVEAWRAIPTLEGLRDFLMNEVYRLAPPEAK